MANEVIRVYVGFKWGGFSYVGLTVNEGETLQDAIIRRCNNDINGYIDPTTKKYIKIEDKKEDETMKERRTGEEIREAIKAYFEANEDDYITVIEELDGYNGYLGDDRYYNMEELDEHFTGQTASEILARTFYGGDDDTKDQNGNRGEFNPNREYFYYNGYGNLVSTNYKDYSYHLDNYFINELIDNACYLYDIPVEVQALINELDEEEA